MTTSAVDEVVIRPRSDRTRSAREDKSRLVQRLVLGACVGLFAGLGLYEAWADGPTFDEPVYVAAGLQAVLHHDLAINVEHPPLPKVLSVLPVLFVGPVVPHDSTPNTNDEWSYSAKFVQAQEQAGTLRCHVRLTIDGVARVHCDCRGVVLSRPPALRKDGRDGGGFIVAPFAFRSRNRPYQRDRPGLHTHRGRLGLGHAPLDVSTDAFQRRTRWVGECSGHPQRCHRLADSRPRRRGDVGVRPVAAPAVGTATGLGHRSRCLGRHLGLLRLARSSRSAPSDCAAPIPLLPRDQIPLRA